MKVRTCLMTIVGITLPLLSGCLEPESDVVGEMTARLQGTVLDPSVEGDGVEVAVFWSYYPALLGDEAPNLIPAERVTVHGAFPASFTLDVLSPPPEFVLQGSVFLFEDANASRVADGYIVAVRPGANYDDLELTDIVGSDRLHSIAYVETDIEAGSEAEYYLGGQLQAGFHVIEKKAETRDCENGSDDEWYEFPGDNGAMCSERIFGAALLGFSTPLEIQGLLPFTDETGQTHMLPQLELW